MIKQFLSFDEAAAELGTDYNGLREGFETGLASKLPAFVYCGDLPFLAVIVGARIESDGQSGEEIIPFFRLPDGRKIGESFFGDVDIDFHELGDELGDVESSSVSRKVSGQSATFVLRGYFRVAAHEMKKAAREHCLGMTCIAPASWWRDHAFMPKSKNGHPIIMFRICPIDHDAYRYPPELKQVRFRIEDVLQLKARAVSLIYSPNDKPMDARERTTLLAVIGALAEPAKLDLSQHHKAGEAVAAMLAAKGVTISGRTIGEHLKAVREAMDSRKVK